LDKKNEIKNRWIIESKIMEVNLETDKQLKCLYELGQTGLDNIGNTCFMNTALQCINAVKYFVGYFLSNQYNEDLNLRKKEVEFVESYANFLKTFWSENCQVRPQKLKAVMGKFYDPYAGFRQNDSAECYCKILELLHEGLSYKVEIISVDNGKPKNLMDRVNMMAIESWRKRYKDDFSIPLKLFYGQYWSRVKCMECGNVSHNFDPFGIVNLPVSSKTNTLEDCINYYVLSENMEEDNKINCEKCEKKCNGKKKNTIWKLPPILTIAFNRFDDYGNKINKRVEFPINRVKFGDLVERQSDKKSFYDLVAIANHSGGLNGGHYWAYTKGTNGKWYEYNDTHITEISEESLVSPTAYYLVYMKRHLSTELVIS